MDGVGLLIANSIPSLGQGLKEVIFLPQNGTAYCEGDYNHFRERTSTLPLTFSEGTPAKWRLETLPWVKNRAL